MTLRTWLPATLALSLCACANPDAPASASALATAAAPMQDEAAAPATAMPASATEGSLDFALSASTVGTNSRGDDDSVQCQLTFEATNRSQAPVKSVIAEFRIAASDGTVIATDSTLVMPFKIPPGEMRAAWGPIVVDDHRCEDLDVAVQPARFALCRTTDESPCPAYRLSGEGVANAH